MSGASILTVEVETKKKVGGGGNGRKQRTQWAGLEWKLSVWIHNFIYMCAYIYEIYTHIYTDNTHMSICLLKYKNL